MGMKKPRAAQPHAVWRKVRNRTGGTGTKERLCVANATPDALLLLRLLGGLLLRSLLRGLLFRSFSH